MLSPLPHQIRIRHRPFVLLLMMLLSAASVQAMDSGCAELADTREAGLPAPPAGVLCADATLTTGTIQTR